MAVARRPLCVLRCTDRGDRGGRCPPWSHRTAGEVEGVDSLPDGPQAEKDFGLSQGHVLGRICEARTPCSAFGRCRGFGWGGAECDDGWGGVMGWMAQACFHAQVLKEEGAGLAVGATLILRR